MNLWRWPILSSFFFHLHLRFFLSCLSASLFTFSLKPSAIKKNAFSSNKVAKGSSPKKSLREFISFCRKSPFFCDTLQFTTWWAAVLFWHRWLTRACYRSLTSHIRDLYNPINPLDKLSSRPSLKLNSNGLILIKVVTWLRICVKVVELDFSTISKLC